MRQEDIPDRRVVERQSDGTVLTKVVEPSGDGSRLTYTYEVCTRMPLLTEAELFVSSGRWGLARRIDAYLTAVKNLVEAKARQPHVDS